MAIRTVQEMFMQQVWDQPGKIAVEQQNSRVTYAQLAEYANRIACDLRKRGIGAGHFVGTFLDPCPELVGSVLGVLLAGGAFVPLDLHYPDRRLQQMLAEVPVPCILVQEQQRERLQNLVSASAAEVQIFVLPEGSWTNGNMVESRCAGVIDQPSQDAEWLAETSQGGVTPEEELQNPAYVYFTSGTTGKPKAIVGCHRGLAHFIQWEMETVGAEAIAKVSNFTPPSHDPFLRDIFLPLCAGGTCCLPDDREMLLQAEKLVDWVDRQQITLIHCVPGLFKLILGEVRQRVQGSAMFAELRYVCLAGEKVSVHDPDAWYGIFGSRVQLVNLYGPTETTLAKFYYLIQPTDGKRGFVPVGVPIKGARAILLDENHQICPSGVIGEIYIRTPYMTLGYYNDPERNRKVFLPNPFSKNPEDLIFKTGDLGRVLPDGNIEFCGRVDQQVKIRGFRVEPDEIEAVLLTYPGIREAVVTAREDGDGFVQLVGYLVGDQEPKIRELREYLAVHLPDYMVPAKFVALSRLPLTPNGKIDRAALPEPVDLLPSGVEYVAPRTEVEATLATIWSEVLRVPKVGILDNFFDLGGHSLKATNVIARIYRELQVNLPLREFFRTPTIAGLAAYIATTSRSCYVAIPPAESQSFYPLSSAQKRLYVLHQLDPAGTAYNIPRHVMLSGDIDRERIRRSLAHLIHRHEALRTSFELVDGEPVQRIHPEVEFDLMDYGEAESLTAVRKQFLQPFDLRQAPLFRAGLAKIGDDKYVLLYDIHHIIGDATSTALLLEEFQTIYELNPASVRQAGILPDLRIQYKDFAVWQNTQLASGDLREQEEYWLNCFAGECPVLELATDYPRPVVMTFEGDRWAFKVDAELTAGLKRLAGQCGATFYMVLFAAYSILLSKYSGQEDIVIGSPIAGRSHADLEKIIGIFINTLALRTVPRGDLSFAGYLAEVREQALEAYRHQDYPFELLVEKLDPERQLNRNPLFDTMLVVQNVRDLRELEYRLEDTMLNVDHQVAKFDLTLSAMEIGEEIQFSLEYSTRLFRFETIRRMAKHLMKILQVIANNPEVQLSAIDMLSANEKAQILDTFNDPVADYPREKTVEQLFRETANRFPERIALTFGKETMTYAELHGRASELASCLRKQGVGANQIVGLLLNRSFEMVIGILAIVTAGGAYMPMDPDYPDDRIRFMLDDSGTQWVVTEAAQAERLRADLGYTGAVIVSTKEQPVQALTTVHDLHSDSESESNPCTPGDLLYVIYTSGSTGKPKGVMIEQRNVVQLLKNDRFHFDFTEQDVWTLFHSYCFDFSVWEMYGALLFGGRLVVVPKLIAQNPAEFVQLLRDEKITVLNQTPTAFYSLQAEEMKRDDAQCSIRYIIFGGEALKLRLVKDWSDKYPATRLINMYGITETTVHVTYKPITISDIEENTSNVGRPLPTLTTYVMDAYGQLVPVGVAGEICVGGAGVARGYLGQTELTSARFCQNPYRPDERIYRSGDRGRFLPDGEIEYLGRIDQQVKIRGYRIELGEIEARLLDHPEITEVVVLARGEAAEKHLCAYYVAGHELPVMELHQFLEVNLPAYMLPAHFMRLERLPLTSNGKVDRKALPEFSGTVHVGVPFVRPDTPVEQTLARIWSELLGVAEVGIDDDFFRLGGHSLKATQLVARIHSEFGVELSLREIFKYPTIREMALGLEDVNLDGDEGLELEHAGEHEWYSVSSAQKRLYIVNQIDRESTGYNMPGAILLHAKVNTERVCKVLQAICERHESLRTSFDFKDGEPVQRIHPDVVLDFQSWQIEEVNLPEVIAQFVRPFDLSQIPLIRVGLIECIDRPAMVPLSVILYDMHHIIADGISMEILSDEFRRLYAGEKLAPLRFHYKDFAVWQQRYFQSARFAEHEQYWFNRYDDCADGAVILNLPTDYPRPAVRNYLGERVYFGLDAALTAQLKEMALDHGATLYMTILSVFTLLLARYSGQEEIIVGSPVAGRPHHELEGLIGMFVNTLPMRNTVRSNQTFRQFLLGVKNETLNAYEHQDYPLEMLIEHLNLERNLNRNPLFDVVFALQNQSTANTIGGAGFDDLGFTNRTAKFDLTLNCCETEEGLQFALEYATCLFQRETVERMAAHLLHLIESVIAQPGRPIAELELLTPAEREQLLVDFNDTDTAYPADQTIDQIFMAQVSEHANRPALIWGDQVLTYSQLNAEAEKVARSLRTLGVKPDEIVGLLIERSPEMIIAIFGILKAGGAYLPLNPADPLERLRFMLEDAGVRLCLLQASLRPKLPFVGEEFALRDSLVLVEGLNTARAASKPVSMTTTSAESLAYVIYTSGTTGQPKGILTMQHNVTRVVKETNYIEIKPTDRILQLSNYAFDGSVFDIYGALLNGAALVLVDQATVLDPGRLGSVLCEQRISIFFVTTAFFNVLVDTNLQSLSRVRKILFGGERISVEHASRALQHLGPGKLVHVYGPTESTVFATAYPVDMIDPQATNVPIGAPLANTQVYIVNSEHRLQPIGVPGELCIAGPGLARGYLNQPDLTAAKFVQNPFAFDEKGERMYCSGDLARWLPDGQIEFLGRIDQQVKIRGFRIEPGEIEVQLQSHPAIREAAVLVREVGVSGEKVLCAYYVAEEEIPAPEVRSYLQERLPEYMLPTHVSQLVNMPLNRNGKVDRNQLPAPVDSTLLQGTYTPPRNDLEERLARIWANLLNLEQVSVHDDFFALGGHSLKVIAAMRLINADLGADYPVSTLFMHPTVARLASWISATDAGQTGDAMKAGGESVLVREHGEALIGRSSSVQSGRMSSVQGEESLGCNRSVQTGNSPSQAGNIVEVRTADRTGSAPGNARAEVAAVRHFESIVQLRAGQPGKNLFLIHPLGGSIHWYKALADNFASGYNLYGIQARGFVTDTPLPATLEQMAAEYIAEIRQIQPAGPYHLIAYCAGSLIVYEMLRQLEDRAAEVGKCILLDSPAFRTGKRSGSRVYAFQRSLRKLQHEMTRGVQGFVARVQGFLGRETNEVAAMEEEVNARQIQIEENIVRILASYQPPRLIRSDLLLLKAADNPDQRITGELWGALTEGQVTVVPTAGDHLTILEEGQVQATAEIFREILEA